MLHASRVSRAFRFTSVAVLLACFAATMMPARTSFAQKKKATSAEGENGKRKPFPHPELEKQNAPMPGVYPNAVVPPADTGKPGVR